MEPLRPPEKMRVQAEVDRLALKLGLPDRGVIVPFSRTDSGSSHLEIDAQGYHWIATERGRDYEHRVTHDLDELLYWILSGVTWGMAMTYEMNHRRRREDFRRQLFAKDLELLTRLDPAWAERKRAYYEDVLARSPFGDAGPERSPEELRAFILERIAAAYGSPPSFASALEAKAAWAGREALIEDLVGLGEAKVKEATVPEEVCLTFRVERSPEQLLLKVSTVGPFALVWRVRSGWLPRRGRLEPLGYDGGRTQLEGGAVIVATYGQGWLILTREELLAPVPLDLPGAPAPVSTYAALFGGKPPPL